MSKSRGLIFCIVFCVLYGLVSSIVYPSIDLIISGIFYRAGSGFYLATNLFCTSLHDLAYYGARVLGTALAALTLFTQVRHTSVFRINSKGWLFLFLALILGPVLIANVGFKDHWGRARPREIVAFGGSAPFSPALIPQTIERKNSSFVSGDGAFGFFLPSFAYVIPAPRSRRFFWAGIAGGVLFGGVRIVMGAHFFSDVMFAAFFMLISSALAFSTMYGLSALKQKWRDWLDLPAART